MHVILWKSSLNKSMLRLEIPLVLVLKKYIIYYFINFDVYLALVQHFHKLKLHFFFVNGYINLT